MHESGLRHKQNVSLKLTTIRKEAKASDIEKKKTLKELEKIEKVCGFHPSVAYQPLISLLLFKQAAKEQFELDKAEQQTFPPETSTILPSDGTSCFLFLLSTLLNALGFFQISRFRLDNRPKHGVLYQWLFWILL